MEGEEEEQVVLIENVMSDLQGFVEKALDIQMDHNKLTHAKGVTADIGNKLRTAFASLIKIITRQQVLISRVVGENEVLKSTRSTYKMSYADKTRVKDRSRSRSRKRSMNKGLVTIYPKKETTSEVTKKEIQGLVNPREIQVGVNAVRKIKKGGIIVELQNKEDENKFMESLNNNNTIKEGYEIGTPKRRDPQIIIYNVEEEIEEQNIASAIITQNDEIEEGELEYRTKFTTRRGCNIIFNIKGSALKRIAGKRIKLGWVTYPFKEYLRPSRCFKCGQYGHIAKHCRNNEICLRCGGEGHIRKDCTSDENCNNCKFSNTRFRTNYDIQHSCLSNTCKIYDKEVLRLISRTDYG